MEEAEASGSAVFNRQGVLAFLLNRILKRRSPWKIHLQSRRTNNG